MINRPGIPHQHPVETRGPAGRERARAGCTAITDTCNFADSLLARVSGGREVARFEAVYLR
jgi:hypothetical protein